MVSFVFHGQMPRLQSFHFKLAFFNHPRNECLWYAVCMVLIHKSK